MRLDVTDFDTDPATLAARQKALKAKPWISKLRWREYKCVPRKLLTGKYAVVFSTENNRRFAECRRHATGEECPANARGLFCYHIAAAYRHHVRHARRLAGKERTICQQAKAPNQPVG